MASRIVLVLLASVAFSLTTAARSDLCKFTTHINASHSNVTDLAPLDFPRLRELLVSHNELVSLDLSPSTHLHTVDAAFNALSLLILPMEQCALKRVNASNNRLTALSTDLSKCQELEHLDVSGNRIVHLDLCQNRLLVTLIADGNALHYLTLPPDNCSLVEVHLKNNLFNGVPNSLLGCSKLSVVDLRNNTLSSFPTHLFSLFTTSYSWMNVHGSRLDVRGNPIPREDVIALLENLVGTDWVETFCNKSSQGVCSTVFYDVTLCVNC